ncbi:MAG TPA: hypothetical protein VGM52_18930 [Herbaspirillum sp.]
MFIEKGTGRRNLVGNSVRKRRSSCVGGALELCSLDLPRRTRHPNDRIKIAFHPITCGGLLWTSDQGFGAGAALIIGSAFVSLRATSPYQATALSGMAQCMCYLFAATGPTLVGAIHDVTGNRRAYLDMCTALFLVTAILGLFAGLAIRVGTKTWR